jgi:hypothetical protein
MMEAVGFPETPILTKAIWRHNLEDGIPEGIKSAAVSMSSVETLVTS